MFKNIKFSLFAILLLFVSLTGYSNANLRNTVVDFNNNVIDFSETGLMDNIRSGELAQFSPLDLEIGSIFIDVDGVAKKVVNIEQSADEIFIDTVQPELREVFEYYDIPIQTINLTLEDHLLMDSVPQDSTFAPNRVGGSKSLGFDITVSDDNFSVSLGATASLAIDVTAGARLPYTKIDTKGTWKFWKWETKYYQGFAQGDIKYDLSLEGKLKTTAKFDKEVDIPIFALTTGPGLDIGAGFNAKTSIEGSISLTNTLLFTLKGDAGAKCGLDGLLIYCWPVDIRSYGSTEFLVRNTLSLEAEVELKEKIYLGVWVKVFGFAIIEADAGGGPYLNFNAKVEGWVQYSTKTKLTAGWSAEDTGEVGVFAEINASVFDGKWGGEIWARKFPIFTITKNSGSKSILPTNNDILGPLYESNIK